MPELPALGAPFPTSPREFVRMLRTLSSTGLVRPLRPDHALGMALSLARWGTGVVGGLACSSVRFGREAAVIDDDGVLTYSDLHARTTAAAAALNELGIAGGDRAGLLARNGRHWVEGFMALSKVGADVVLLNTGFAGPQLADVLEREGIRFVLHDSALPLPPGVHGLDFDGWDDLVLRAEGKEPPRVHAGGTVVLTSGTTGAPKGAARGESRDLEAALSLLSVLPFHARERTVIAAPLFHAWGLLHLALGALLSTTYVLPRTDAEAVLAAVDSSCAEVLATTPVMLQRILALPADVRARYNTASLRIVAVSGSSLPAGLATRFMDAYGDVLYNLYGSTEVAWATIATPEDLRADPDSAGRPPPGVRVRLLNERNHPVPHGRPGRIFVGSGLQFDGYTDGGGKEIEQGLMSTGDLGRWDSAGRLVVLGREDDMVVSGGENVFPSEVERLLARLDGVREVAVVGVPDEEFGQRLRAVVVQEDGAALTVDGVRDHVRHHLARFKIPRDVVFVDELPRNPAGKILRNKLAETPG